MINNLILIVVLVVIFRIIFEILFFSKSIKEGFPGKKNWDKTSSTGKDSWDTTQDTEDKKNEMNSNCCPENNYSYETYPVPDNCLDGEDDISCLWRVKRSNQIININGAPPFKAYNKKIYGSNALLGRAMNSLANTNQETELGWVKGTLTDISSNMFDTDYFWKLFNPNINLKCNSGRGEGVKKAGQSVVAGNSPYIKSCIKKNISLINQYENKELAEIPCDGMDMSCYYTLFRGSQGSVRMSETTSDSITETTSDMYGSGIDVYINKGDWWLKDEYVQKRVLLYNLKAYINYYGSLDDDLDTVIKEMHNKTDKTIYLNNDPGDAIGSYSTINRETFFKHIIGIWNNPDNLKNVNKYLAERLGRYQVWFDSNSDSDAQDSEITNSLKVENYVSDTIYDFKLNDAPTREEFHLFKYDEKIEALIEEIDNENQQGTLTINRNTLATKMLNVVESSS